MGRCHECLSCQKGGNSSKQPIRRDPGILANRLLSPEKPLFATSRDPGILANRLMSPEKPLFATYTEQQPISVVATHVASATESTTGTNRINVHVDPVGNVNWSQHSEDQNSKLKGQGRARVNSQGLPDAGSLRHILSRYYGQTYKGNHPNGQVDPRFLPTTNSPLVSFDFQPCQPMDVVFVVDSSDTIRQKNFNLASYATVEIQGFPLYVRHV